MTSPTAGATGIDDMTYTGIALTPNLDGKITYNSMTLAKVTDFTYSYSNNTNAALSTAAAKPQR